MKAIPLFLSVLMCVAIARAWPKDYPDEEQIRISGTLTVKIFPGPPEFESVEKGDRPERVWLLVSETVPPASKKRTEVYQIMPSGDFKRQSSILRKLEGRRIKIDGTIWCRITGHHHTQFLITPTSIEQEPNQFPEPPLRAVH